MATLSNGQHGELHLTMCFSYARGLTIGIYDRLVAFIKSSLSLVFLGQPTSSHYFRVAFRPPYQPLHKQKYFTRLHSQQTYSLSCASQIPNALSLYPWRAKKKRGNLFLGSSGQVVLFKQIETINA